jgi:hypothetical protein
VLYTPTNLDALITNLQNIKVNNVERPAKNRATPYRTQVLLCCTAVVAHTLSKICVRMCKVFNGDVTERNA